MKKDKVVQLAQELASEKSHQVYSSIKNRIAYVVSHGASYASNGYAVRTQRVARSLIDSGKDVFCFVRPGRPWELNTNAANSIKPVVDVNGVRYIHSRWENDKYKISEQEHLKQSFDQFCELFQIYRPEKVIAASNWKIAVPAWAAAKALNIPFAYEIRGFWELSRIAREPEYKETPSFRKENIRDTFVANQADKVFTLSYTMKAELTRRGVSQEKISVIYNGLDTLPHIESANSELRRELGISDSDKVVGYVGSITEYEGLEVFIDACRQLIEDGEQIKLLLVGDHQPVDGVDGNGFDSDFSWLIRTGRVSQDKVPNYLALIDTIVIPRRNLDVCQIVPPMKAIEALSYGKKLVISNLPVLKEITEKFSSVYYFEADNINSLKETLIQSLHAKTVAPDWHSLKQSLIDTTLMGESFCGDRTDSCVTGTVTTTKDESGEQFDKKIILNSTEVSWFTYDVESPCELRVMGQVAYQNTTRKERKAVLLIKAFDKQGKDISKALGKLAFSSHLQSKFKYITDTNKQVKLLHKLALPPEVRKIEVGLCAFNCESSEFVEVHNFDVTMSSANCDVKVEQAQTVTKDPLWTSFSVREFVPHTLTAKFNFENQNEQRKKSLIARVKFHDSEGNELEGKHQGLLQSKTVGNFVYLEVTCEKVAKIIPPKGATTLKIGLQKWDAKGNVFVERLMQCTSDVQKIADTRKASDLRKALQSTSARPLANVKVAAILDEFTMECFRMEVDLVPISPENWESELDASRPDFLFVESCWFGNKNQWGGLIYGYTSNGTNQMDSLVNVINYCNRKGIPTVFWSKEDPVHYSRFAPTAKLFDYVYTTDANMVQNYKSEYGIDAEPLSFFCQPKVHNPVEVITRSHKAAFAGSYYSDKQERCDDFHTILGGLDDAGVPYEIYDRCLKRGVSHLQFPEYFKKHVVGYLEPDEMWKAYKGYRYTVNMNTVKHSPTMFARRVYESLASGTPVISNYSEGVVTQFSGIVCASDNKKDIIDYVEMLKDEKEYKRIAEQGARETLGRHTIADRLEQICKRVGIPVIPHLPVVNAVITAGTVDMVEKARRLVNSQTYFDKRLVINLENSNELYPYLNMNSDKEIFRVLTEFAKPLEGVSVDLDLNDNIAETLMEDVAIKTQYDNLHSAISEKQ